MSRLTQRTQLTDKLNDRRFGKGTVCRLLYGNQITDILLRYNIVPPGTVFGAQVDGKWIAAATDRGLFFVVPIIDYPELEEELKNLGSLDPIAIQSENLSAQEIQTRATQHEAIVSFLRQKVIMVRVPRDRWPNGSPPDPDLYDLMIETIDVSQTLDGLFVDRPKFDYNKVVKLG